MSSFPKDLYFEIAPHSTIRTLVILCLCSRAWHLAASSVLYRDIGRFTADEPSVSANLLQTVASSERIGRLVQRLHVYCSDRCAVRLLSQALRNTPNLRSLRVRCLGSVIKEDESCREALIDLKQLRVLSFNFLRDNAVFCRLGPLRHIRITGNAGRAGPVPNIERMIMKSCDTITHLNVSSHLLRRIMDGIPSSAAVFAHLETIMINDTLPLLLLLGQKLPALKIIRAKQLNQRYLLHDPEFLPSLEALQFPCIPDPTAGDSPAGRDVTSSRPGRNLRHLNLEMSDMITTSSTGSVDEFYSFVEPVKLGSLSSLTLNAVRDVQSLTALSALQYELTQGNNLRMIYLELRMRSSGVESVSILLRRSRWSLTSHRRLCNASGS